MSVIKDYFHGIWILFIKELKDQFSSPLIYVLTALFSMMMGWLFFNYLVLAKNLTMLNLTQAVLLPVFGNMNFIFLFLAPLLTMGLISEEKKRRTLPMLQLSKLTDFQIIFSKYLASLSSVLFLLFFTTIFPIILSFSGYNDWGTVATSYTGIILSIMCYIAVGLFTSSITSNQIISAITAFCILLGSILLVLSVSATSNQLLSGMVRYLSTAVHYESFIRGEVKSFDIVYFISFIGFFLYLTKKSLDSRNW